MIPLNASQFSRIGVCALLLLVSACVTTKESVFTNEASPEEAVETRLQLARSYIGEQNWEDARRNLKIAADIEPNAPDVHEAFALLYSATGENELAEERFKKAIALDPNFSRARNNYAGFLYKQKRFKEAEAQLEIVVLDTLYESRSRAYLILGLCRLNLDDIPGARDAFSRVLKIQRTNSIALLELAQIEFQMENWSAAQQYYGRYRSVVRRQSARALWLGVRLSDKLNDNDAKASYGLALRNIYPNSAEFQAYERAVQRGKL
jgi:type IV pilus assembly protein PilF